MTTPPGDQPADPNQPYGQVPPPPPGGGGYTTPPQPGGYGQPGYPPPAPGAQGPGNNPMAITSLVLGIVGLPLVLCCGIGLVLSIPAAILGWLGMKKADESNGAIGQRGLGLAGLILGGIGVLLGILWIILAILGTVDYNYSSDFS